MITGHESYRVIQLPQTRYFGIWGETQESHGHIEGSAKSAPLGFRVSFWRNDTRSAGSVSLSPATGWAQ